MRAAAIDIGTNSVKLCVCDQDGGELSVVEDIVIITKLGDDLASSGRISREASDRTIAALDDLCARARGIRADRIKMIATECVRRASNGEEFAQEVRSRTGEEIDIISGATEAELSFAGCVSTLSVQYGDVLYFDIGGGSSEIALGDAGGIKTASSAPVGALVLSRMFFSGGRRDAEGALSYARDIISPLMPMRGDDVQTALVSGGSASTIASVMLGEPAHAPDKVAGAAISRAELERQISIYSSRSSEEIKKLPGMDPGRADTIIGGACALLALIECASLDEARLCVRGLRHGAALSMLRGEL